MHLLVPILASGEGGQGQGEVPWGTSFSAVFCSMLGSQEKATCLQDGACSTSVGKSFECTCEDKSDLGTSGFEALAREMI